MKYSNYLLSVCFIIQSSGCALDRQIIVENSVGPAPWTQATHAMQGELVVYSELELANSSDIDEQYHTGYKVYSSDGTFLKYVENKTGARFTNPETINLLPGRYKVVARTLPIGTVSVPVVIEAGRTTIVCLDGTRVPRRRHFKSDFVRLPDGSIIGWRAPEERTAD